MNTTEPLVSVIVAAYNAERYIYKCVKSILNQTYNNLEVIVVNDGSKDATLSELNKIRDSGLKVFSQTNSGASASRNFAFSKSSGEYIAFLDADDMWFPDKLENDIAVINRVKNNNPVCLVYSWYYCVDEQNRLVNFSPKIAEEGNIAKIFLEKEGGMLLPSSTTIHRKIFEEVGGFPVEEKYLEDRPFFIRATKKFPGYPTKKRTMIYLQSTSGKCRSVLQNFNEAVSSTETIRQVLKKDLSEDEINLLEKTEKQGLFYRFLMYNYPQHAKRLYEQINKEGIASGKKGFLAILTLKTGINFLYLARNIIQFFYRFGLLPWWRAKTDFLSSL